MDWYCLLSMWGGIMTSILPTPWCWHIQRDFQKVNLVLSRYLEIHFLQIIWICQQKYNMFDLPLSQDWILLVASFWSYVYPMASCVFCDLCGLIIFCSQRLYMWSKSMWNHMWNPMFNHLYISCFTYCFSIDFIVGIVVQSNREDISTSG